MIRNVVQKLRLLVTNAYFHTLVLEYALILLALNVKSRCVIRILDKVQIITVDHWQLRWGFNLLVDNFLRAYR